MKFFRLKIILMIGVVCIIILISVLMNNFIVSSHWINNPEPPGTLINFSGYRLYVTDKGSGRTPIVILHDILSFSPEWWNIQDNLSNISRVVTFDREGYGWSSSSNCRGDSAHKVQEIVGLLDYLDIHNPCILIGHGIGGLYAQHYAFIHPDRVKAIILVDPITANHNQYKVELKRAIYQNLVNKTAYINVLRIISFSGLIRAFNIMPKSISQKSLQKILKNHYSLFASYNAMYNEYTLNLEHNLDEIKKNQRKINAPIVIINPSPNKLIKNYMSFGLSYDEAMQIEMIKMNMIKETASLSNNGYVLISDKGSHDLHIKDPEIIINAVNELLLNDPLFDEKKHASLRYGGSISRYSR